MTINKIYILSYSPAIFIKRSALALIMSKAAYKFCTPAASILSNFSFISLIVCFLNNFPTILRNHFVCHTNDVQWSITRLFYIHAEQYCASLYEFRYVTIKGTKHILFCINILVRLKRKDQYIYQELFYIFRYTVGKVAQADQNENIICFCSKFNSSH